MATTTPSTSNDLLLSLDTDPAQELLADLEVACCFFDSCDSLLSGVRTLVEAAGCNPGTFRDLKYLDILLCETKDKIEAAQEKAEASIDLIFAAQRAARA